MDSFFINIKTRLFRKLTSFVNFFIIEIFLNMKFPEMKHLNKEKEKKTKVNLMSSGERKLNNLKIFKLK